MRTLRACLASGAVLAAVLWLAETDAARAADPVDLELVLAVDASLSVDGVDFDLQRRGLAAAFRDPAVGAAIRAAGDLGVAVTVIQWANPGLQRRVIEWRRLRDGGDARALAAAIETSSRLVVGGSTSLSGVLAFARRELRENAYAGRRRVIDISGDGRHNRGRGLETLRRGIAAEGTTINGLAILDEEPELERFYLQSVIAGPGAFVVRASDSHDFADAIRRKLIREIAGQALATLPGPTRLAGQQRSRSGAGSLDR